jgi:hypothetical protein
MADDIMPAGNSDEESLQNVPPTPVEGPTGSMPRIVPLGLLAFSLWGGCCLLLTSVNTPCRGATRSSKLQWQARQAEMDRALQQCHAVESEEDNESP